MAIQIPFKEALALVRGKRLLPTNLDSEQLMKIAADIRGRSLLSACVTMAEYLQEIRNQIGKLSDGNLDAATARQNLRDKLESMRYEPERKGSIKDFSSEQRLNLVIKTNTEMAQNYGTWVQDQNPEVLDMWPAQELIRWEDREEKRDWRARWTAAGGQVFSGDGPDAPGRLVALKNDPVWERLSVFGLPYPPFDFNSGIGVQDVTRNDAIGLGLIDRDTQVIPRDQTFNKDLKAAAAVDPIMKRAILDSLGEGYSFDGDVLTA